MATNVKSAHHVRPVLKWLSFAALAMFVAWQGYALRTAQLARQEAQQLAETWLQFVGHSSQAVILTDERGEIIDWNPGAEELLGYTAKEAKNENIEKFMPKPMRERHQEGIADVEKLVAVLSGGVRTMNCQMLTKSGEEKDVNVRIQGVHAEDGRPFVVVQIQRLEETRIIPNPEIDERAAK